MSNFITKDGRVAGPLKISGKKSITAIEKEISLSDHPLVEVVNGQVVKGERAIPTVKTVLDLIDLLDAGLLNKNTVISGGSASTKYED